MLRQAEEEQEWPSTSLLDKLRNYYDYSLNVAGSYVDSIKDLKLDEKAKWVNISHGHTAWFYLLHINLINAKKPPTSVVIHFLFSF